MAGGEVQAGTLGCSRLGASLRHIAPARSLLQQLTSLPFTSSCRNAHSLPAGIGVEPGLKREAAEAEEEAGGTDAGHRVLVFAQLKGLLDLVESEVGGGVRAGGRVSQVTPLGVLGWWPANCLPNQSCMHARCRLMQLPTSPCAGAGPAARVLAAH